MRTLQTLPSIHAGGASALANGQSCAGAFMRGERIRSRRTHRVGRPPLHSCLPRTSFASTEPKVLFLGSARAEPIVLTSTPNGEGRGTGTGAGRHRRVQPWSGIAQVGS